MMVTIDTLAASWQAKYSDASAMPIYRLVRHFACGMKARVAVTGNDLSVKVLLIALADLVEDAGHAKVFVIEGFDQGRSIFRRYRNNLRARLGR